MRTRRLTVALAASTTALLPVLLTGLSSPASAAVETCVNQFTGAALTATVVGSDGADFITARSNDVISAKGGNDVVYVSPFVSNVTICLGDGNDQLVFTGGTPVSPLSVMGGPGSDSIPGSNGNDALNGGDGTDSIDGRGGYDTCKNGEFVVNCEIIL
ncbi:MULTISPECIES: hypothetical protein [unclassified Frankia]|uniref:hypothetical protein n=1 Tax=unclassified Frankia TaxID=2632575 RepID=UPI002024C17A